MASRISPNSPLSGTPSRHRNHGGSSSNPVVAAFSRKSDFPYNSMSLSPDRQYAVTACKDTIQVLQVDHNGIQLIQTIPIGSHFHETLNNHHRSLYENAATQHGGIPFRANQVAVSPQPATNVVVTNVAWSRHPSNDDKQHSNRPPAFVATAGSNGAILIWCVDQLLSTSSNIPTPETVRQPHLRSVNKLAWHPSLPILLSASQDGTVKLWERHEDVQSSTNPRQQLQIGLQLNLFGGTDQESTTTHSWYARTTYEPKSEGVRDIKWSPYLENVTVTGSLIAYNRFPKPHIFKLSAHSGDATSLDWHPTNRWMLATGGARDRTVKIWDLEPYLNMDKKDNANVAVNFGTLTSRGESITTDNSSETERSMYSNTFGTGITSTSVPRTISSSGVPVERSKHSRAQKALLHILSISASVTNVRWRPPANDKFILDDLDRHSSMLAVATAPIKGASAGFPGLLALWSYQRPYMPLSIVQGHKEGAVIDFDWLDTPQSIASGATSGLSVLSSVRAMTVSPTSPARMISSERQHARSKRSHNSAREPEMMAGQHDYTENAEESAGDNDSAVRIWQHAISVGRDGRCLLQSFARGEQPLSTVPRSCLAMANVSPFQKGCGSLQVLSVCQTIPSGPRNEFLLTGLRKDNVTAQAPGVFREFPDDVQGDESGFSFQGQWMTSKRMPPEVPKINFAILDQCEVGKDAKPSHNGRENVVTVAPEVLHMSRFAQSYIMYPTDELPNRVDICRHNGSVAHDLGNETLAHMWNMIASMLESSGMNGLPDNGSEPGNVMQFMICPTIESVLEERANAGDVQSCVTLCEVLQVLTAETCRVPKLEIATVREWYLSYIDLLRDMCMFQSAAYLISNCKDPFVGTLNQQSTIHEACPNCGKPVLSETGATTAENTGRRACKSCRRRIGLCFLCHEPVKGMYVWCPGCGHGGHMEHAIEWFGAPNGKPLRQVCPTGCGHRCNFQKLLSAFPRTESFKVLVSPDPASSG